MKLSVEIVNLIGTGTTSAVAIAAMSLNYLGSRENLRHQNSLAQDGRLWDRRANAYTELLRFTHHVGRATDAGDSDLMGKLEATRTFEIRANVDAFASDDVRELTRVWLEAIGKIYEQAEKVQGDGDVSNEIRTAVNEAIDQTNQAAERIRQQIRIELGASRQVAHRRNWIRRSSRLASDQTRYEGVLSRTGPGRRSPTSGRLDEVSS
ncbi:MAG TPA: hypothetical protein VFU43_19810 [Streptosporangiaceae bacterium]|nr:hypothetical protein [Streptosporangiaceae bacterium]